MIAFSGEPAGHDPSPVLVTSRAFRQASAGSVSTGCISQLEISQFSHGSVVLKTWFGAVELTVRSPSPFQSLSFAVHR